MPHWIWKLIIISCVNKLAKQNVIKIFYASTVSVNDDVKHMINLNYRWLTPGVLQHPNLKPDRFLLY